MTNYAKKEEHVLDEIAKIVNKLDKLLDEEGNLEEAPEKEHKAREWYIQKRATHELKRILHEINKYDNYREEALEPENDNLMELGIDADTINYMSDYFG